MEIEQTQDGSSTLFVPELDEHYHSIKGAVTESRHIFIRMGLEHSSAPSPHVLEIGFGTGLNAFLTLLAGERLKRDIRYTSIERYPLTEELVRQLDYPSQVAPERADNFYALHRAAWDRAIALTPHFTLHKIEGDFTRYTFTEKYDLIYFDAFAPEKQPEMWEQSLFNNLFTLLNPQGILTTYCAKGTVRRMLQAAGFKVERLPGPPNGKREILRGSKERDTGNREQTA